MSKKAFVINVEGTNLPHIEYIESLCKEHGITAAWDSPETVCQYKYNFYGMDNDLDNRLAGYYNPQMFTDVEMIQLHELEDWLNTHYPIKESSNNDNSLTKKEEVKRMFDMNGRTQEEFLEHLEHNILPLLYSDDKEEAQYVMAHLLTTLVRQICGRTL